MHGNIKDFCFCSQKTNMHDIPSSDSFICPLRKGFLQKLTGRGWLYSGTWKSRYCVLDGSKFYFYEKEQSRGNEKNCGVINLDYYDLCEESKSKDKKNPHVFVIGTSVKGLFDNRHQFGAETSDEMQAWIHSIQNAIREARISRTKSGRRQRNDGKSADLGDSSQEPEGVVTLVTATKDRAKGPQGRRLPQRKSMMPSPSSDMEANDIRQRSISLSSPKEALEELEEDETTVSRVPTAGDSKWLSLSMEEMERGSDDAFEAQRSSSAFDIANKQSSPSHNDSAELASKPVHKRMGPRLGNLLGQHAALTKELEMKLKIGPRRQHSESEEENQRKREEEADRNIEQLSSKVNSAKDTLNTLEEKVSLLSRKVEATNEHHEKATSQVGDVLLQVTVTLQEAERINSECKRALEEVNKARTEYQNLVKECKQTLARLKSDPDHST